MNNHNFAPRSLHFGYIAASVLFGCFLVSQGNPAIAQQSTDQPSISQQQGAQQPEEVEVLAPRVVRQTIGRSTIGAPIEIASIAREVSYSDIDLSTPSGAAELENRVSNTARALCQELDSSYPLSQRDRNCVLKTTKAAMRQVNQALTAAGRK